MIFAIEHDGEVIFAALEPNQQVLRYGVFFYRGFKDKYKLQRLVTRFVKEYSKKENVIVYSNVSEELIDRDETSAGTEKYTCHKHLTLRLQKLLPTVRLKQLDEEEITEYSDFEAEFIPATTSKFRETILDNAEVLATISYDETNEEDIFENAHDKFTLTDKSLVKKVERNREDYEEQKLEVIEQTDKGLSSKFSWINEPIIKPKKALSDSLLELAGVIDLGIKLFDKIRQERNDPEIKEAEKIK